MPESPEIAALAKQARDGLGAAEDLARRAQAGHTNWPLPSAGRRMEIFGTPGVLAALELIREHSPTRILADVAARRTLLDTALGWGHGYATRTTQGAIYCAVIDAPDSGYDCDCGRDARVRAVLTALATPYQEET